MRLKTSWAVCAVLLFFMSEATASFFSDSIRSVAAAFSERRATDQAPTCTLSADEALVRTIELLSAGRQAEAEGLIKSAVKTYRDDIRILFAKAVIDRSRWCNKDAAQVWFAMARKAQENESLSRAAWLSMQLDQYKDVEKNMAELIRLSDEHPDEIFLLWIGAIQCREQSKRVRVSPNMKQDMAELGRQRYEKLLKKFRLGPVMVHQTYANILAETLKDYEPALEHRILAVSMEANSWSLYGMGNTLVSMGKNEWGCAVLARVVRRNPYDAKYVNRLGDALYNMARYDEALEKYYTSVKLKPREGYLWEDLGDCLNKLGKKKEMFKAYQRAVELRYDGALGDLGWCYHYGHGVEKNGQKAFELYWLYADKTDSIFARYKLGDCYSEGIGVEKDLLKAREYYEEAVALNPKHTEALNLLAWDLATSKDESLHDYPRAVELAKRSIALDENNYNLDTLAVAYLKNKQFDEAVQTVERIIAYWQSQHPGNPVPAGRLKRLERYKKFQQDAEGSL